MAAAAVVTAGDNGLTAGHGSARRRRGQLVMHGRLHMTGWLRGWRHGVAMQRIVNGRLCVAERLVVDGLETPSD